MTQEALTKLLAKEGYSPIRLLPTGEWAGIQRMMYTVGLFVGLTQDSWRTRFCFETRQEAEAALFDTDWDGTGFPPGYWIKQKPEEISNPNRRENHG